MEAFSFSNKFQGIEFFYYKFMLFSFNIHSSFIIFLLKHIYRYTSSISIITNKVNQLAIEWQNKPLESLYMIVWMYGIVFKVREAGKVINKTVYLCVGIAREGYKEVLGMWVGKNESGSFWLGVH